MFAFFCRSLEAEADYCLKQGGIRESKGYNLPTFGARGQGSRNEVIKLTTNLQLNATELACAISQNKL